MKDNVWTTEDKLRMTHLSGILQPLQAHRSTDVPFRLTVSFGSELLVDSRYTNLYLVPLKLAHGRFCLLATEPWLSHVGLGSVGSSVKWRVW